MKLLTGLLEQEWKGVNFADAQEVLARAWKLYSPDLALACSFSLEDVVLIDLMAGVSKDFSVFAIDTGRLNPETYECAERIRTKYGLPIRWYFPERQEVESLESKNGLFSFRESLEARKTCCAIRKVEPLSRALTGLKAWITGMRREQSETRSDLEIVVADPLHGGITKINPLANWTLGQTWEYVKSHEAPYNRLYDQGYTSIGCAPCTRAIRDGEGERAGRWWWESPDQKECGLHIAYPRQSTPKAK